MLQLFLILTIFGTDTTGSETPKKATLFADGFESGGSVNWVPDPERAPNCSCYFSGDCRTASFCNYGPAGPFTEDICNWRLPKPSGQVGKGCDSDVPSPGPICDGICLLAEMGSMFGSESPGLVSQALQLWTLAMLQPAGRPGGGPVARDYAEEALNLPFHQENSGILLGRHVADLLSISGGLQFYHYFCHFEFDDQDPRYYADLSDDPCRLEAGLRLVDGLVAELDQPGSGLPLIDGIRDICPEWQNMFTPKCAAGPAALECVKNRVLGYVTFLRTPRRY